MLIKYFSDKKIYDNIADKLDDNIDDNLQLLFESKFNPKPANQTVVYLPIRVSILKAWEECNVSQLLFLIFACFYDQV